MRFFAVLAFAAAVSAASLNRRQNFPTCAIDCLTNADTGTCDASDDTCLCRDQGFISSVTSCLEKACSGQDLTDAETGAQGLCAAVGVTLTATPTPAASSASSSAASTTASGNSSGAPAGQSSSATAPSVTQSQSTGTNGAASHSANALVALAAVGVVALIL